MLPNNGKGEHTGTPNNSLTFFSTDQFTELFIHTWAHLGDDLILNIHNGIEVGHIENMIERRCGGNLFEFFCICSFDAFEKEETWITNRDLLYDTWNSAQCYVAVWMEGEFGGRMDTCICMVESLYYSPETITLLISYTPIQNKVFFFYKRDALHERDKQNFTQNWFGLTLHYKKQ